MTEQNPAAEEQQEDNQPLNPDADQDEEEEVGDDILSQLIMKTGLLKGKNFIYTMASVGSYALLYVIFMAFLAVYGWKSPDPANCFFIDGLDAPGLTKDFVTQEAAAKGIEVRPKSRSPSKKYKFAFFGRGCPP